MFARLFRLHVFLIAGMLAAMSSPRLVSGEGAEIWHIKAVHPEGELLPIKALGKNGEIYDVKAIAESGNRHMLSIKAFIEGKAQPLKVLASDDFYGPVKAIDAEGTIYDVKALTADGEKLDVKAVSRSGSILDIKAIGPQQRYFGVKAISPAGHVYDVKGVKMLDDPIEQEVNGVPIRAHVKALPQVD